MAIPEARGLHKCREKCVQCSAPNERESGNNAPDQQRSIIKSWDRHAILLWLFERVQRPYDQEEPRARQQYHTNFHHGVWHGDIHLHLVHDADHDQHEAGDDNAVEVKDLDELKAVVEGGVAGCASICPMLVLRKVVCIREDSLRLV